MPAFGQIKLTFPRILFTDPKQQRFMSDIIHKQALLQEFGNELKLNDALRIGQLLGIRYSDTYMLIRIEDVDTKSCSLVYSYFDFEVDQFITAERPIPQSSLEYYRVKEEFPDDIEGIIAEARLYYTGEKKFSAEEDERNKDSSELMSFSSKETYQSMKSIFDHKKRHLSRVRHTIEVMVDQQRAKIELLKEQMQQQMSVFQNQITKLNKVIVTLELYSGIKEELVQISKGEAAASDVPLTIRQQMLYFDEELADPRLNENQGLSFDDLEQFFAWMIDSSHYKVMLPEEKCMITARVRRNKRNRKAGNIADALRHLDEDRMDMTTFLLIRNGDNVYYLSTENIHFYGKTFPERKKLFYIQEVVDTLSAYPESLMREFMHIDQVKRKGYISSDDFHRWKYESFQQAFGAIDSWGAFRWSDHREFRKSDTAKRVIEQLEDRIFNYKMTFTLIQGILDRSGIFSFPSRVSVFEGEAQEKGWVKLLYDDEVSFPSHRLPFAEWKKQINAEIKPGSRILIAWGKELWNYKGDHTRFDNRFNAWRSSAYDLPKYPGDGVYTLERFKQRITGDYTPTSIRSCYNYVNAIRVLKEDEEFEIEYWVIKYNPKDEIGWKGWTYNPHERKNRISFKITPQDPFVINYDLIDLDTIEFYLNDRINRQHYLEMMPFLNNLRKYLEEEQNRERHFVQLITDEISRSYKIGASTIDTNLIWEDIEWYKLKNQIKRPITKEEDKAYRMIMRRWKKRLSAPAG